MWFEWFLTDDLANPCPPGEVTLESRGVGSQPPMLVGQASFSRGPEQALAPGWILGISLHIPHMSGIIQPFVFDLTKWQVRSFGSSSGNQFKYCYLFHLRLAIKFVFRIHSGI